MARSRMSLALPTRTVRPSTFASSPWPGTAWKSVASTRASLRSFAASTTAWASGCSLEPSADAASRRTSSSLTSLPAATSDDAWLSDGQRAGLVEDDGADLGGLLEGGRILEQDPVERAEAGPDHDRRRRRQAERIRAGDDDDGDREREGEDERRAPQPIPASERQQAEDDWLRRDKPLGGSVGESLGRCLRVLGLLNELDYLG